MIEITNAGSSAAGTGSVESAAPWTIECRVHFRSAAKGRKRLNEGAAQATPVDAAGSVPRVARLLAVAHAYRGLIESGAAKDYADLARITGVSRARVTQVMGLLHLAPDIQEAVLDLPRTYGGAEAVLETELRAVAAQVEWGRQRRAWSARARGRG